MKYYPNKSEILYARTVITDEISSIYSSSNRGEEVMAYNRVDFKGEIHCYFFSNITSLRFSFNYPYMSECHLPSSCSGGGGDV